jgi:hypothetical protein
MRTIISSARRLQTLLLHFCHLTRVCSVRYCPQVSRIRDNGMWGEEAEPWAARGEANESPPSSSHRVFASSNEYNKAGPTLFISTFNICSYLQFTTIEFSYLRHRDNARCFSSSYSNIDAGSWVFAKVFPVQGSSCDLRRCRRDQPAMCETTRGRN